MTSDTVADVITDVHEGLPETWTLLLDGVRDAAQDWPQYRSTMLAKEHRTRIALKTLKGPLLLGSRGPDPSQSAPAVAAPATAPPTPFTSQPPFRAGQQAPIFRRPARTAEEKATYRLDVQLGRCFNCHTADHAKRDCPRLHRAVSTVRQLPTSLENEQDDEVVSYLVRSVGTLPIGGWATEGAADRRVPADDDDDISRVRVARRVSVSMDSFPTEPLLLARAVKTETVVELPGRRHRDVVAHKVAVYVGDNNERLELHVDGDRH